MSAVCGGLRSKRPCFPQELFDLIIDCIDDKETLEAFSLTSHAHRPRCKSRLFRKVILTIPGYKKSVDRLDSEALNIYKSVRHIVLRGSEEPIAAILDEQATEASTESDCESDAKSDTDDEASDSSQLDLAKALQDIDQLSAFLQKLTRLDEITVEDLGWNALWSRSDTLLLPNLLKTVSCVRLERVTFASLADAVVFIMSFKNLRILKIVEIYWEDDDDPIALTRADKAAKVMHPLTTLRALESWATPSTDMWCYIMNEELAPELQLRQITLDCLHNFEVTEWGSIVKRAGEHLEDLHVRFAWCAHGQDTDDLLDFTANTMLRRLTFQSYESKSEEEAKHVRDMLSTVSSTVIEEIALTDIVGDEDQTEHAMWDALGLDKIDELFEHNTQFHTVKRLVLAVNMRPTSESKEIRTKMQEAAEERMPKAIERGLKLVVQVNCAS